MFGKIVVLGAAGVMVAGLSGCSSSAQDAAGKVESAASAVQSAAARASAAASEAVDKAQSAAASIGAVASNAASALQSAAGLTTYTMDDVKSHNTSQDCWAAINGKVYNLTNWEDKHPGGADKITALCGTDATAAFTGQHDSQPAPNAALIPFLIGTIG